MSAGSNGDGGGPDPSIVTTRCEKSALSFDRQKLIREIGSDTLRRIYTDMVRTRALDDKLDVMVRQNYFIQHSTKGQEGSQIGVCSALKRTDFLFPYHRGWGWAIGKGMQPKRMMAEFLGRSDGYNKGKGGVQLADWDLKVMGRPGVQGAHLSVSAGAALGAKMRGQGEVVLAMVGDGGSNTPNFFEALNLTSAWKAPAVYVVENNGYAVTQRTSDTMNIADIADRAVAFGIPGVIVDGNDAVLVHKVTSDAIERARRGEGPTLIESKTYRLEPHAYGDRFDGKYRTADEIESWRHRDPIKRLEADLIGAGVLDESGADAIRAAAIEEMDAAEAFALASPLPTREELLDVHDVYA